MTDRQLSIAVREQSQIGEARRQSLLMIEEHGFTENSRGKVGIVVTELATNLARHATGGEILLRVNSSTGSKALEILAIDRGPGIADVSRAMTDGYSTAGTAGNGLGAVHRLCNVMDVFSTVPTGTVIFCRIDDSPHQPDKSASSFGIVNLPAPYEIIPGDTWRLAEQDDLLAVMVVDGLGHGPDAAKAAAVAGEVFDQEPFAPLDQMFAQCHAGMLSTRGGALSVAHVNRRVGDIQFLGVGNIAAALQPIIGSRRQGFVSHNGTVGLQLPKLRGFSYSYTECQLLILHSDGLQTRWLLEAYPGLVQRHSGVIAGVLYRDFCRGRDDVTVVVARLEPP